LISDETKFKPLSQNPTKSREDSLSTYLRKLKDGIIDGTTFQKILPRASTPGVLYGLPKVHKAGCPYRPIVSSVNTYNYNPASFLVGILQPISANQHTVKDSFSFADWAKTYKHNNEIMCSFDVSSLFTNVPLDETIHICLDKLYSLPDPPKLPRSAYVNIIGIFSKTLNLIRNLSEFGHPNSRDNPKILRFIHELDKVFFPYFTRYKSNINVKQCP
jgi:hypothetical protein